MPFFEGRCGRVCTHEQSQEADAAVALEITWGNPQSMRKGAGALVFPFSASYALEIQRSRVRDTAAMLHSGTLARKRWSLQSRLQWTQALRSLS